MWLHISLQKHIFELTLHGNMQRIRILLFGCSSSPPLLSSDSKVCEKGKLRPPLPNEKKAICKSQSRPICNHQGNVETPAVRLWVQF